MTDKIDRLAVIERAKEALTPWQSEDGRLFLDYMEGPIRRTLQVTSAGNSEFRGWFTTHCIDKTGFVPNGDFVSAAQAYFAHWCKTTGPKLKDFIRVGGKVGALYYDVGNDGNDAWSITADGIKLVKGGPSHLRLVRGNGMLQLPTPDLTAKPADLPRLLGELTGAQEEVLMLLTAWLLGTMRPEGPYPVLTISGEQGSGKSTVLRLLRRIVDPHALDMRTPPEDQRDLQAIVRNSFLLAFDNVSFISNKMSDALCVISTGTGAQGGRALYTNAEESAVRVCRPIVMNGIPDVIERGDLVDRSIHVHLPRIDPKNLQDDYEFWKKVDAQIPVLLGALMQAALTATQNYGKVVLKEKPRMSAFAVWVTAAEEAFGWESGRFLRVYKNNRSSAEQHLLEFHGLASAIMRMMGKRHEFTGTYQQLITELEMNRGPGEKFPNTSHGFAAELRRIRPALERHGLRFYNNGRSSNPGEKGRSLLTVVCEDDSTAAP